MTESPAATQVREDRLTPDLLYLRERWPREAWASLPSGSLAKTWLAMHDSLREGQAMLERLATHWQLKMIDAETFRARALPVLRQHLGHLHGHHRLEDTHYFPQFRRIEPRLEKGFDLLERDHTELNQAIHAMEDLSRQLAAPLDASSAAQPELQMAQALHRAGTLLRRHLTDEEDLVIPLLAAAESPQGNPTA